MLMQIYTYIFCLILAITATKGMELRDLSRIIEPIMRTVPAF